MRKHLKYLSYILRHKWFVFVECVRLGIPFRGVVHDLSKMLPSEWLPYAEYFYGEGSNDAAFDVAWLKHQHRNLHHWQYWILREDDGGTKLMEMPEVYVREMLADWRGAGRALGFDAIGPWYAKNRDKIQLHDNSRALLHSLMLPEELGAESC